MSRFRLVCPVWRMMHSWALYEMTYECISSKDQSTMHELILCTTPNIGPRSLIHSCHKFSFVDLMFKCELTFECNLWIVHTIYHLQQQGNCSMPEEVSDDELNDNLRSASSATTGVLRHGFGVRGSRSGENMIGQRDSSNLRCHGCRKRKLKQQ